ncbi:YwaF family protein [Gracilibacillus massiliensis]|uniref:YwaF family protein n=1 Tax=Gracilibacillus massiliensis TaxID=1564956 RepID=UPI00071D8EBC|nr:TIGR02206 family membrane protein [Gracilibacillus massiliensis]
MDSLVGFNRSDYPFHLFSLSHIYMVIITVGLLAWMYIFRENIKRNYKRIYKNILIVFLILGEITFHLWYLSHDRWDVATNLPLQLCSISLYLCTIMLLTKNFKAFEVSFFVSMTGAFIAIVTPELFFGFPHMRFFQFFIAHIAIILSCFYMIWIEEYKPSFRSVIRAFVIINIMASFVFVINQIVGSNYMFLAEKPNTTSIIDFLGPYPWYILSLEAVAFTIFLLLYFLLFKIPAFFNKK